MEAATSGTGVDLLAVDYWSSELAARRVEAPPTVMFGDIDTGDGVMPGLRQIEIVSTVRLYFAAPDRPPPAK